MRLSRTATWMLRVGVGVTLAFIYIPLIVIAHLRLQRRRRRSRGRPPGLTSDWFDGRFDNQGARDALVNSLKVGLGATAHRAAARHARVARGRALPLLRPRDDLVPGHPADRAAGHRHRDRAQRHLHPGARHRASSLFTIIVGHATFCIVVVYNNVLARLRRVSTSFEEASADLGADTWQTFRRVTLPNMRTALVAGALLAFALSFDEIIVTTFTVGTGEQTLPIWIFQNLFRPNQLPIVNVVALSWSLLSMIPVYFAHRLTREEGPSGRGGGAPSPRRPPSPEPTIARVSPRFTITCLTSV